MTLDLLIHQRDGGNVTSQEMRNNVPINLDDEILNVRINQKGVLLQHQKMERYSLVQLEQSLWDITKTLLIKQELHTYTTTQIMTLLLIRYV